LTDDHEMDENNIEIIDEAAEGYQCSRVLDMPQTLTRCLQDTDTKGIKIRHKLKFRIQLHNPDGHISEVSVERVIVSFGQANSNTAPRYASSLDLHFTTPCH